MSNIDQRGLKSVTAETARGIIAGFGLRSYLMGLDALLALIGGRQARQGKKATNADTMNRLAPGSRARCSSFRRGARFEDRKVHARYESDAEDTGTHG